MRKDEVAVVGFKRKDGRLNESSTQALPSSAIAQEVASQRFHGRISQGSTLFAIVVLDSYEMTLARIFTVDFPPLHGD